MTSNTGLPPLVEPGPELTADERARFARHLLLPDVGTTGQRRLRAAKVLVIGAGGLGSPVLLYLAAAGVGHLTIVDDDLVDAGNLQRQVIHSVGAVGRPKVESAADRVADFGGFSRVDARVERIHHGNALDLVGAHDLVIDGSDNFATRYLVADACEIAGRPLIWGTLDRFRAQVAVFWSRPPEESDAISLRDIYPSPPPPGAVPTCAEGGVVGALCGQVGSMMALEAVKLITGAGRSLLGRLLIVDSLEATTRAVRVKADPGREPARELVDPDAGADAGTGADAGIAGVAGAADSSAACAAPGAGDAGGGRAVTLSPAELSAELDSPAPPVLLDVRGAGERAIATIEPSVWVPLGEVAEDAADPTGRVRRALDAAGPDAELVVYCKAGVRSATGAQALLAAGVERVRSLAGGIDAWTREVDPSLPTY